MLFLSGFVSAVFLLCVNLVVWCRGNAVLAIVLGGIVGTVVPLCLMGQPYLVLLQGAVLLLVYVVWRQGRFGVRTHVALSCAGTLLLYATAMVWEYHELSRLRTQFAYVSLEERLPPRPRESTGGDPAPVDVARLDTLELQIDPPWRFGSRERALEALHEHTVVTFANSPGFGVGRMAAARPRPKALKPERNAPAPAQPGLEEESIWTPPGTGKPAAPAEGDREPLLKMHDGGVVDFIHPSGFGHVKDRRNVAGFEPHQFSKVPQPTERWAVEQLDLVSLLLHERPVAYVSERLPKMDELRGAPTRQLDEVETEGLQALRNGEDLFLRSTEAGVRMVGSLRAANQCVKCHDGQRGDLLGAFSYRLRPAK